MPFGKSRQAYFVPNPKARLVAAGGCDPPGEIGVKKTSLRPTPLKKKLKRHMGAFIQF